MGTIINPTPAATMLEEQRLGYVGCSLTNFDSTAEPQIVGNAEVAGSLSSFASAESITGWSALSNGDVYIKVVPDTGAGTVAAEFTDTAPTWDDVKQGWYGTGAAAPDRYFFKLNKTGASGYEDKRSMNRTGDALEVGYRTNQDTRTTDSPTFANVNTGHGANELYEMNQNVKSTDAVTFASVDTGQGANELYDMNQNVTTSSEVQFAKVTSDDNSFVHENSDTYGDIFSALEGSLDTSDLCVLSGTFRTSPTGTMVIASFMGKPSTTSIRIYGQYVDGSGLVEIVCSSGGTSTLYDISICTGIGIGRG